MYKQICSLVLMAIFTPVCAEEIPLSVAGSVSATGNIQQKMEKPFFESLGEVTGLDILMDYSPIDLLDMSPAETLQLIQYNVVDIASIGIAAISTNDAFFLGLDLVGLATDYHSAKIILNAYEPVISAHLKENYGSRLLGVWPFGPQVLFCKPKIKSLKDISGLRVRVYDPNLGAVIEDLGGVPVQIKFSDVQNSLKLNLIDCAITGPSSANTAGWVAESTTTLPLGFQIAFNAYAINLERWNGFTQDQKKMLSDAFDEYISEVWSYSEQLYNDALRCNIGNTPCETVQSYSLQNIEVTDADSALIRNSLTRVSLPNWLRKCSLVNANCEVIWRNSIGEALELK